MRTPRGRNYYNPHFTDEETEIHRGHTAGRKESQDFECLHSDVELSSLPDEVKCSVAHLLSVRMGVGAVPSDSSHPQRAWSSGKGSRS